MSRVLRGAVAALVLFAWALPCHDAQADRDPARGAFAASGSGLGASEADSAQVRRSIDEGNAAFVRAWMTGDADLFAGCFAADGALLHPGRPPVVGREKIRERMKGVFAKYRMTAGEITTVDVFILGDTAYETGKWKFAIGPVGEAAAPDSGRYIEVWKREDGGWRMWRDIGVPE